MHIVNSSPPAWCQSLSVPLYTPSLCWQSTYIFISKIQIHLANKWFRLLKHFEHLFTVDLDSNPDFLMSNVQSCPCPANMQKGCQNLQPFAASNLADIALHSHTRLWIPAHHTTELRIGSSRSGKAPRHMHTQKKPFGISMKNRPSKKTSSIQMSPQISRESMTTSAVVADEETHTYTPLPPIVLLGHSSN